MLTQDQLREALREALKAAKPPCGVFCTSGATIEDGKYALRHNGVSTRDTDSVVVYSQQLSALNAETLAIRLKGWIDGLHRGSRVDLNKD